MSDWKAARIVVQGIIEWPDGTTKEATFQITPDGFGRGEGVFRAAQVFICHERVATYDMKVETTDGQEKVMRGSKLSIAGEALQVPLEAPKPTRKVPKDRLNVIPAGQMRTA